MSRHLSSREVSQWMIGERTPQQEQHVRQCPECGAEVARMEAALALFRGSVRHWSDRQVRVPRPLAPTRGSRQGRCAVVGAGGCRGVASGSSAHGAVGEAGVLGLQFHRWTR